MLLIIIGIIIGLLILTKLFTLFIISKMKQAANMTSEQIIDYSLKGSEEGVITVGIIKDGNTSYKVYGKDGKEIENKVHTYEIGSVTKTITAAMICNAQKEGLIDIDEAINTYLPLPHKSIILQ